MSSLIANLYITATLFLTRCHSETPTFVLSSAVSSPECVFSLFYPNLKFKSVIAYAKPTDTDRNSRRR